MLRRAKVIDVPQIVNLINFWAAKNEMLSRSQLQVYNSIRDYVVIEENEKIIGVGALHVVWCDLAEIRSLAIAPERIKNGLGSKIVNFLLDDAKSLEMPVVFTLTYKPVFFEKLGFNQIDKKELPHKVWKDCLSCPKFPDCDEIALVRSLVE